MVRLFPKFLFVIRTMHTSFLIRPAYHMASVILMVSRPVWSFAYCFGFAVGLVMALLRALADPRSVSVMEFPPLSSMSISSFPFLELTRTMLMPFLSRFLAPTPQWSPMVRSPCLGMRLKGHS